VDSSAQQHGRLDRLAVAPEGRVVAFLLFFSALLFFPFLGTRHMTSEDEAQRAVPPREMLETGDWIVPRLNGQEYLKKPPMLYWQIAPVYAALYVNEWTARLTCAITGLFVVLVTYWWGREMGSRRMADGAGADSGGTARRPGGQPPRRPEGFPQRVPGLRVQRACPRAAKLQVCPL